jgi:hydroxymethylpyrimidine pyrophosphatase-like HAD family hydrolase
MIKMVVSSFYNTLIDEEEAIPTSTMLEIERIRKKGIVFTICTNRGYKEVLDYNKDFPFIDYIVSLNGTYIYDVSKNKCLFKKKITLSTLTKLVNLFPNNKINYYTVDEVYTDFKDIEDKTVFKIEVETHTSFKIIKHI